MTLRINNTTYKCPLDKIALSYAPDCSSRKVLVRQPRTRGNGQYQMYHRVHKIIEIPHWKLII